jgi:transcription antitermination factor NusG
METTSIQLEWYALNVRARQEHMVSSHLMHMGQEQFLPVQSLSSNKAGREIKRALFPGYVFCRIDWNAGPKLYKIPGIIKVVGAGRTPIPIPEAEIDAVRKIVDSGIAVECLPLVVGSNSMVVVHGGPLQGIKGMVVGEYSPQSLIVSVPLLRRSLAVVLDRSWLIPALHSAA